MNIHLVPVPEDRLAAVYAALANGRTTTAAVTSPVLGSWTMDDIATMFRQSPRAMKAILRELAKNPGNRLTAPELAERIDRTRNQFAGVLGAFGRRVKNRYGKGDWPFLAEYSHEDGVYIYEMSPEVAELIREVDSE